MGLGHGNGAASGIGVSTICVLRLLNPRKKAFQRRLQSLGSRSQVLPQANIEQATNNFGNRIGHGGFGDVFDGRLADRHEIAAKMLTAGS